eukprot:NODE_775_length_2105_cov_95.827952_g737_i0.p1 GENE.NODE_775_length_2105_cov_95.827952_g737_i0~~NODE_775_length_2105_cov_95.827952_g737_i0.p1  ORF type:complete len:604 (-),score=70.94 NODE_775_length_2105_cov_95.827952_g737_i0:208-2019(-)
MAKVSLAYGNYYSRLNEEALRDSFPRRRTHQPDPQRILQTELLVGLKEVHTGRHNRPRHDQGVYEDVQRVVVYQSSDNGEMRVRHIAARLIQAIWRGVYARKLLPNRRWFAKPKIRTIRTAMDKDEEQGRANVICTEWKKFEIIRETARAERRWLLHETIFFHQMKDQVYDKERHGRLTIMTLERKQHPLAGIGFPLFLLLADEDLWRRRLHYEVETAFNAMGMMHKDHLSRLVVRAMLPEYFSGLQSNEAAARANLEDLWQRKFYFICLCCNSDATGSKLRQLQGWEREGRQRIYHQGLSPYEDGPIRRTWIRLAKRAFGKLIFTVQDSQEQARESIFESERAHRTAIDQAARQGLWEIKATPEVTARAEAHHDLGRSFALEASEWKLLVKEEKRPRVRLLAQDEAFRRATAAKHALALAVLYETQARQELEKDAFHGFAVASGKLAYLNDFNHRQLMNKSLRRLQNELFAAETTRAKFVREAKVSYVPSTTYLAPSGVQGPASKRIAYKNKRRRSASRRARTPTTQSIKFLSHREQDNLKSVEEEPPNDVPLLRTEKPDFAESLPGIANLIHSPKKGMSLVIKLNSALSLPGIMVSSPSKF